MRARGAYLPQQLRAAPLTPPASFPVDAVFTWVDGSDAAWRAAVAQARGRQGEELIAAEIRLALDELGLILGAVYTDDILDRIFSRFCIGK